MTIVVTGSAGHLGEALMRTLRAEGRPARGVDIKRSTFTNEAGTICDRTFVRHCLRGADAVIHAATLHKPHVVTHSRQDFIDTNVSGTLNLLEEAAAANVRRFIYTSTTSAFGSALTPGPDEPTAWVTEEVHPIPKNIYGVTKIAAENLCELFARKGMTIIVLRTSRFFPESDDDPAIRGSYDTLNAQANELLYRRVDIADVVSAHLLGLRSPAGGFRRYIISATTPFTEADLPQLRYNAPAVVHRLFPDCERLFAARRWRLFPNIDRVYVNKRAKQELGWQPRYDFRHVLDRLRDGDDFRSPLARDIGIKGYHDRTFEGEPYPVL